MDNEKNEQRRGIFLGVIGVLTLIVAIIGASFAYFSINAKSEENAVSVQAASVQIVYSDGDTLELTDLIPSKQTIAVEAYNRSLDENSVYAECVDDNERKVCGVYNFTLTNNGTGAVTFDVNVKQEPTETTEEDTTEVPKFKNLKFILSEVSGTGTQINTGLLSQVDSTTGEYKDISLLDTGETSYDKLSISAGVTKKYRLFVWLDAATNGEGEEIAQDDEQGAVFKGTVHIDVGEAYITGEIND